MKSRRVGSGVRMRGLFLLGMIFSSTGSWGGIVSPLYLGNVTPVQDEFGRPMKGSPLPTEAAQRCRVEIRTTTDGYIHPPSTAGIANSKNPLLTTNSVGGMGENSEAADTGLFCLVFPNRPAAGTKVFARVFDAPTAAQASFYADTQLLQVSSNDFSLKLVFGTIRPLDPGDADGDGLNNSWERVLGTADRPTADYDADGMSDLQEMRAGTDPRDDQSLLVFQGARSETGAPGMEYDPQARLLHIRWLAVPGKSYQLEAAARLTADPETGVPPLFAPLGDVVSAGAGETTLDVWVDISAGAAEQIFRIRLAGPGAP